MAFDSQDFGAILSSISSSHIARAASPRPPFFSQAEPFPPPALHHRTSSGSSSRSHPSIHSPSQNSYHEHNPLGLSSSGGQHNSGWGGRGDERSYGFDGEGAHAGGGPGGGHLGRPSSSSFAHNFGEEQYNSSSAAGQGFGGEGNGQAAGGVRETSGQGVTSASSFDFDAFLPQHQDQQQQPWMFNQQQQQPQSAPSANPFDFNAQPLPQFNFLATTNPPSPTAQPDNWLNPSLSHRSQHNHSPSPSFDGSNQFPPSRSRSSSFTGSTSGGGGRSGPNTSSFVEQAELSAFDGGASSPFGFSSSDPAAVDEAMRGLTFEDLALIASVGGSPLPQHSPSPYAHHLPSSPDPSQQMFSDPASPYNHPSVTSHTSSPSLSSHQSPYPQPDPSPPQFNIVKSPSPPASSSKPISPPSLIIPPDPTDASLTNPQTERKPSSASTLFPPVDPRMAGIMRLTTEGAGGPGGPQINIVPSTPTSGQLAGQIFSQHLAELNRKHQEQQQLQQQSSRQPPSQQSLPQASPQPHPQPPLHSLGSPPTQPSFAFGQQAGSSTPGASNQTQQQFTDSQAQFVALMSMQMAQQQLASQQMAQFQQEHQQQQQQQAGGAGVTGGAQTTAQDWMARLAQMGQWQGGAAHQQQQQSYGGMNGPQPNHFLPHQHHAASSFEPYTFGQPQPQQHQAPFPAFPYQYQPSQPSSTNPPPRQLKAPPVRQRSRSEASLIPYDFGPPVPQAPTMDPSLLPGRRTDINHSFLSSSSNQFNYSADPTSLSDDGSAASHQGSLPSPSTFDYPFFMAPVRKPTDDAMSGGGGEASSSAVDFGLDGGAGPSDLSHPRRSSFGQRAFGPGTPEYGRGLLNPWGRGGGGEGGDDGSFGGGGAGVRRSLSDAGGRRKGHRKAKSAEVNASAPDFLRSITRSDGTLGIPTPHASSSIQQQFLQAPSPSWSASSPEFSPSSRSRSRSPTPDILALDPDEAGSQGAGGGGSDGGGSVTSNMSVVSKHSVTTKKTAAASQGRRKVAAQFVCPIPGCGSTFTRSFNLKGHLRSHTDERPFKCETCGKAFARQHDCKRHMALHVGYRPHTCLGCQRKFARLDALARHLKSDAGQECIRSGLQAPIDEPSADDPNNAGGSSSGAGPSSSKGKKKASNKGVLL